MTADAHDGPMMIDHAGRIASFVSERWPEVTEIEGLGTLVRAHGLDLDTPGADPASIERGTPVYVHENADAARVLRRMAEAHVRYLFVVNSTTVVGVVDIRDLVERAAALAWPTARRPDAPRGAGVQETHGDSLP